MTTTGATAVSLEHLCSIDDIFHRHLLPLLSRQDAGRLESTSLTLQRSLQANHAEAWKILCERDYTLTNNRAAPAYSVDRQSFDALKTCETWKGTYQMWKEWEVWTDGTAKAEHMVEAIELVQRLKTNLKGQEMDNIIDSLAPSLSPLSFQEFKDGKLPSSLAAFFSIHAGQQSLSARSTDDVFFGGLFGSYACYNNFYSMRLFDIEGKADQIVEYDSESDQSTKCILVGISPGNPRMFLYVRTTPTDPEGEILMVHTMPLNSQSIQATPPIVGRGGFLKYLRTYVERLEAGVYRPTQVIEESTSSRGMGLFTDANVDGDAPAMMGCCVTRGIEVRASARWFPGGIMEAQSRDGLNFGYSVRIRMVAEVGDDDNNNNQQQNSGSRTCQLVGRHWEFMSGDGSVRRVDGDGVIGKQPKFFRDAEGNPGFVDLGPAGERDRRNNTVFVYQSQSGPVAGTTQQDTSGASVKGTFSFMPGSIANPTGPMFHVTVPPFPLTVPFPFY